MLAGIPTIRFGRLRRPTATAEFVAIVATLTSLTALSIDALLPALAVMGDSLEVSDARTLQWVVSVFIAGMVLGEIVVGPVSDAIGRRPTIFWGLAIYVAGTLIAMWAGSIEGVLLGRFVQGVGVSGTKIASRAMVRDRYEGDEMARLMSFVFTLFIVVPMIAPFIGQAVISIAHWRAIFGLYLAVALLCATWVLWRQPETLVPERRLPLDPGRLKQTFGAIVAHRRVMACTAAAGFVFGAHLLWLSIAPTLLHDAYHIRESFPRYFAALAASAGLAALLNGLVVRRFGAFRVSVVALSAMTLAGALLYALGLVMHGGTPLAIFMIITMVGFACIGLLFGNLNALAMQSLGAVAGIGASMIASLSSLVAVVVAVLLGRLYDGGVDLVGLGFAVGGGSALALVLTIRDLPVSPVQVATPFGLGRGI